MTSSPSVMIEVARATEKEIFIMAIDKDRAIITQVAAKIAADLTTREGDPTAKLGEFAVLFTSVTDILIEQIYGSASAPANVVQLVQNAFQGSTVEDSSEESTGDVQVKGEQHGTLPAWLIKACKRDKVTLVYDNRNEANVANRRPWFKAVDAEKAYWPPKAK